ncbi:hybrid-cluster NAD(P)-dependent oxidoreductase [Natronospirillum operosum]|uniref:Hybrid-cluster NAD(P)-dependent oxidoreductase n=1 Tax=Natronospirillum operosum TaxID=2759953 RepID=A0A4Z0WC87_9GAMM|nr:hybrid-cluster NAD(P)-dependent oxidoreductase [Natronospirillum operosum]TGG91981.1 hybrid-cluster NAD(P)-dependent oxidoreductase [Natronospirillum operosum]
MTTLLSEPATTLYSHELNTRVWSNGRHQVRCVRIIHETHDVKTFCFNAEQAVMFFFKPGQFVTLELEIDGEQVMRSYTISSSPSVPYSFSITIKRIPGGRVSNWLHDHLKVHDEVVVHGPTGLFNCIDHTADKVLFLSGGVGITPVMSMARWLFDTNAEVDVAFVHSARTPADLIFQRELEHMSSRVDEFVLHLICERVEPGQAWPGYRGFLDQTRLEMMVPDYMERLVFCCGPEPYMRAVRNLLQSNGFDMDFYHQESFNATPVEASQEALEHSELAEREAEIAQEATQFSVTCSESEVSAEALPGETVHAAAARAGIPIPKACGVGICGTCRVLKTSGEVDMQHNGGITDEDVAAGYILSCCSVPRSDVAVAV